MKTITHKELCNSKLEYNTNENNCWIPNKCSNQGGYPIITVNNKKHQLNRLMYKMFKGSFQKNLIIRHTCDNRLCINPDHLITGTNADNVRDMVERDRIRKGIMHHKTKLTEKEVIEIYNDNSGVYKELSKKYNVSIVTIGSIKIGKTWSHLTNHVYKEKYKRIKSKAEELKKNEIDICNKCIYEFKKY